MACEQCSDCTTEPLPPYTCSVSSNRPTDREKGREDVEDGKGGAWLAGQWWTCTARENWRSARPLLPAAAAAQRDKGRIDRLDHTELGRNHSGSIDRETA